MSNSTTIGSLARAGVLELGDGYRTKRSEHGRPGLRIIRVADVHSNSVHLDGDDFVALEHLNRIGSKAAQPDDILLTTKGTIGRVATMPKIDEPCVYSPQLCYFRIQNSNVLNPIFWRFWLQSPEFLTQASYMQGNTDMAPYISLTDLRTAKVQLPSIDTQQAIAEVLGALDDKINANKLLARTAIAYAHAEYVKLISSNEKRKVQVKDVIRRLKPSRKFNKSEIQSAGDYPILDQSQYGIMGFLSGEGNFSASPSSPILYFGDHTCKLRIATQDFIVGPNTIPFVANEYPELAMYFALTGVQKHEEYKRHWKSLLDKNIDIPDVDTMKSFTSQIMPIFANRNELEHENNLLGNIRDDLIPQLISGKIRVKDAEKLVSDAV
ncbi:restriction endonuclease subunit S [Glutamicibacter sp. AOP5-A2-7]